MAFPDDSLQTGDHCEICGAELSSEVVIQEFADGSLARLCSECAAGASLEAESNEFVDVPPAESAQAGEMTDAGPGSGEAAGGPGGEPATSVGEDLLERTRELLTPVADLIGLQHEVQGALERLAASLESFAAGVISDNLDKTAEVESRLEGLERDLEQTRMRLRETEALLFATAPATQVPEPAATEGAPVAAAAAAAAATAGAADAAWDLDSTAELLAGGAAVADAALEPVPAQTASQADAAAAEAALAAAVAATAAGDAGAQSTLPPTTPPLVPPPVAPPAGEHRTRPGFQLAEVQLAQRYFNESPFTARIRDVRKSLGKPKANLTKLIGTEPRALLTITWDIIWYQYLVDLHRDVPTEGRVRLHREGMDLGELTAIFKEKNASIDDEGRLDASELEVKLLSDPSTLITEMTADEEKELEDATEEVWDQKTAPEFKWDD